jgi:hypothetical protein
MTRGVRPPLTVQAPAGAAPARCRGVLGAWVLLLDGARYETSA